MSQAQDLLVELRQIVNELRTIAQEGVPSAAQALGEAGRLQARAATLVRSERGFEGRSAVEGRRDDLIARVAVINARLGEIDNLLV